MLRKAPKRVNHAAAAVDGHIFSFGGYFTENDYSDRDIPIEVYMLDAGKFSESFTLSIHLLV